MATSVSALNEQAFASVSIICGQVRDQLAPSTWVTSASAVSLFAALGFGTIVAAIFTRWNAVSQLRQAWVNDLRSEIAELFNSIESVKELPAGLAVPDFAARRSKALHLYRKVQLRLNMLEKNHRELNRNLTGLLVIEPVNFQNKVDAAIRSARVVLKEEWDRTKYGPFLAVARRIKRFRRRRWIRKERRKASAKLVGIAKA